MSTFGRRLNIWAKYLEIEHARDAIKKELELSAEEMEILSLQLLRVLTSNYPSMHQSANTEKCEQLYSELWR